MDLYHETRNGTVERSPFSDLQKDVRQMPTVYKDKLEEIEIKKEEKDQRTFEILMSEGMF